MNSSARTPSSRLVRWLIAVAASVALTLAAAGCNGPSLPLPPPAALVSAPSVEGLVTIEGDALSLAYVLCLNEDTEQGVITRANEAGHFTMQVRANAGQTLSVWQQIGNESGPLRQFVVPAR